MSKVEGKALTERLKLNPNAGCRATLLSGNTRNVAVGSCMLIVVRAA